MFKTSVLSILIWIICSTASAAELTAEVDNTQVAYGEKIRLSLSYDGNDAGSLQPDFTALQKDFEIRSTSSSLSSTYSNGSSSQQRLWILDLFPKESGKITVPSIKAGQYSSQAIEIEVLPSGSTVKKAKNANEENTAAPTDVPDFRALIELSDDNPYVNQEITAVLTVSDNRNLQLSREPSFEDAQDWEIKTVGKPKVKQQNGENVTEFYYTFAPLKSGTLSLPRAVIEGFYLTYDNAARQRPASAWAEFLNWGFNDMFVEQNPVLFKSESASVNVKPVPEDYTAKWWLPAEIVVATAEWIDKNPQFKVGETVAREISITASGVSEKGLPEIELQEAADWKQYPDKPQYTSAVNDNKFISHEAVRVVYIPQKSGKLTLPEIKVPWFNTLSGKIETAVIPSEEIEVEANEVYENLISSEPENIQAGKPQNLKAEKQTVASKPAISKNDKYLTASAVIIAFISGLFIGFLLFGEKRKKTTVEEKEYSLNELKSAMNKKDYRTVRDLLVAWGQHIFVNSRINNLDDLSNAVQNESFSEQCRILNAALYGNKTQEPDITIIIDTVNDTVKKKKTQREIPLPNLYK